MLKGARHGCQCLVPHMHSARFILHTSHRECGYRLRFGLTVCACASLLMLATKRLHSLWTGRLVVLDLGRVEQPSNIGLLCAHMVSLMLHSDGRS